MDLTLQRQRGHFVEMEMSADARVRTENTSKFVDINGQFEYSAHRGHGEGSAYVIFYVVYHRCGTKGAVRERLIARSL